MGNSKNSYFRNKIIELRIYKIIKIALVSAMFLNYFQGLNYQFLSNILEVNLVLLLRNSNSNLTYFMLYKISSPKCHICTIRNDILYRTGNNFIQVMSEILNAFIHKNDKDYNFILLYIKLFLSFKIDNFKLKLSVPLLNFRIK